MAGYRFFLALMTRGYEESSWGFGNTVLTLDHPAVDVDDIRKAENTIAGARGLAGVTIMNIIPLPITYQEPVIRLDTLERDDPAYYTDPNN